ncbi:MAG: protein kinase domain-containing protein [Gemmatimonadales bacterium]
MHIPGDQLERLRAALASRYRLLRELGRGGMATVYLAEDLRHARRVAVKVLRPEVAATLGADRFLREIRIAAQLAHPHILPLHDSGEADGCLYYVMPYVEGETLRDRLGRQRQIPIQEAVRIAGEVADALGYAHQVGVIHRDIKPENILFLGGHAVIADFGVAAAVETAAGTRLTQTGISVGTPVYMSPEQALGEGRLDGRSDLYSLGCVLYEMLAGRPPFQGPTMHGVLAGKLSADVPRLPDSAGSVSPMLAEAVRRALAREPADRFATAGDFAEALVQGVKDGPRSIRLPVGRKQVVRSAALGIGVLILAVVGGAIWRQLSGNRATAVSPAATTTIAVLPLENLGPAENEYFPIGITDEIATRLSSVAGISIVPRRAAQRYTRTGMTMREIGNALRAGYLLVGSVRWDERGTDAKNVRIALELIQARDERQLWATTYDRVIDDIFEVQADIAGQVVERLGVALTERERTRLQDRPTANHEAYTLYLKGRYFWNKRTEKDIELALGYFQRAVDLDPGYSLAWVGIGDTWIFRGWYSLLSPRETFPKARTAVMRALEFDSTLAEAHTSLAHIHLEFDYDWQAAERGYRRAIELNPRYPIAHHWYGGFLSAMGRHQEALAQADTARRLDPLSLIIQTWIGLRYYFARQHQPAISEYLKALELDRDFPPAHWHLGWAYEQSGDLVKAIAQARTAVAFDPNTLVYAASLARAYALAGQRAQARDILSQLAEASAKRHVSAYHVALVHLGLGDRAAGLTWLERAFEERSPWIGYLRIDPRLDPVRAEPRFIALLRQARLAS